jgi:predicted DNA-binding transcriptional regulator YafY
METVSQALYDDKQIEITYMATSSKSRKSATYSVTPYALLYRDTVTELVGRIEPEKIIRRWVMHRIKNANVLEARAVIPRVFNLDDYVEKDLAYPFSGDKIKLVAWFHEDAINHVMETKLSRDQDIKHVKDGVIITATVRETIELKWWLLGLGERVEVIGPKGFRANIKDAILGMAENYKL